MQQRVTEYAKILQEHRELNEMVCELRSFLERSTAVAPGEISREVSSELPPSPKGGEKSSWGAALSVRLVALHDRLFRHFREEEASGTMSELSQKHPAHSARLEELLCQHGRILRDLRTVLTSALASSGRESIKAPHLCSSILDILDLLAQHERKETELIEEILRAECDLELR